MSIETFLLQGSLQRWIQITKAGRFRLVCRVAGHEGLLEDGEFQLAVGPLNFPDAVEDVAYR
jgi:hypothetical protein